MNALGAMILKSRRKNSSTEMPGQKFTDNILTIERGDILKTPFGYAEVQEIESERIRVHPYHGPDVGWFTRADVIAWRDATWQDWDDRGIAPADLAKAMFPGNWR